MTKVTKTTPGLHAEQEGGRLKWFFYGSLIVVFLLMSVMSFSFGISGDEMDMNGYGKAILDYFLSFGRDQTVFNLPKEIDRDGVLPYYGGFFDLVAAVINKVSPFGEYATRHLLNAWAGFLAIVFAAKLSQRIKGFGMAILTVWLMFLAPFFLGHSMNNPKDIPMATAYIGGIYCFIRFAQKFPKVDWKDYLLPIIALGLTIDIRVAGILLIPYMGVWMVWQYLLFKERRLEVKKMLVPVLIISITGYLFASVFWPFALQNPIMNPLTALSEVSHFKMSLMQVYDGERVMSDALPGSYLIHSFFITNPYIILTGLLLGFLFMLGNIRSKEFALIGFVTFITLFPLIYIIYTKANVYHAWRHVLFIFPSAAIIAAYGWYMLLRWVGSGTMKYIVLGIIALGFFEPAYFTVRTFPQTACYYNILAGGVKEAYFNYEMDFYYNSLKDASDWFKENEYPKISTKKDTVILATNHGGIISEYFKDYPLVKVRYVRFYQRIASDWDYAIYHRALVPLDQIRSQSWEIPMHLYATTIEGLPLTEVSKRPSKLDFKGYQALQSGQQEEGISDLLAYYKIDDKNELVNGILSLYYMSINQPDSARQMAIKTLQLAPENADAQRVLADLNNRRP